MTQDKKAPSYRIKRKGCKWFAERKHWWGWSKLSTSCNWVGCHHTAKDRKEALAAIDYDLAQWRKVNSPVIIEPVPRPTPELHCV